MVFIAATESFTQYMVFRFDQTMFISRSINFHTQFSYPVLASGKCYFFSVAYCVWELVTVAVNVFFNNVGN